MKKFNKHLSIALVLSLVLLAFAAVPGFAAGHETTFTIFHFNDTHGRVEEGKYDGMGFPRLANVIEQTRTEGGNVLVLDAGDSYHGKPVVNLNQGELVVDILNELGVDAQAPGNHDFNYGYERLLELEAMANYPILAANVKMDGKSLLEKDYTIKKFDGVKVGIFGLSTPETMYKTNPLNVVGVDFEAPAQAAKEMVAKLEMEGCDVIIALGHLGNDDETKMEETSKYVLENVDGIDIFVDGHSHETLEAGEMVNGALLVQAGYYDKNVGRVDVTVKDGMVTAMASLVEKGAEGYEDDATIQGLIDAAVEENRAITDVEIGYSIYELNGERAFVRTGETRMGNLITTAIGIRTGADAVITNGGGIRATIGQGIITKGHILEVLPFGNYVVVKNMSGQAILDALNHGISAYPETNGGFPHVYGIKYTLNYSELADNFVSNVWINGQPLDPMKMYKVATNDFVAAGGDGYSSFGDATTAAEFGDMADVVMEHIEMYGIAGAAPSRWITNQPIQ